MGSSEGGGEYERGKDASMMGAGTDKRCSVHDGMKGEDEYHHQQQK